ncbi:MAG: hypothetical protein H6833_07790 [Planctomycetes bacterium]|nr:hypothetical protein [Planctomycetota bacterium]
MFVIAVILSVLSGGAVGSDEPRVLELIQSSGKKVRIVPTARDAEGIRGHHVRSRRPVTIPWGRLSTESRLDAEAWLMPPGKGGCSGTKRLFAIGNSYTMPVVPLLQELAKAAHHELVIESHLAGGLTLRKHAASEALLESLSQSAHFDWVLIQEQSQIPSFPDAQLEKELLPYSDAIMARVRLVGARPVLYLTWGRKDGDVSNRAGDTFLEMQERLQHGYARMASQGKAHTAAVGQVWQVVRERHPELELYAADGSHPSVLGVYLAGCTIHATLFGEDPGGTFRPTFLDAKAATLIDDVVRDAVTKQRRADLAAFPDAASTR